MERKDIFQLENRRKLYNFILNNPGLHLRELSRRLKMKYFNLNYHINHLRKLDLVIIRKDDFYLRIYAKNKVSKEKKNIVNIIRKKTPRHILIFMCTYAITSQKELSDHLDKHPSSIKVHLEKLIDMNIIEKAETKNGLTLTNHSSGRNVLRIPKNHEILYRIKDYKKIKKILYKHKKSLYQDKIFKTAIEYLNDRLDELRE